MNIYFCLHFIMMKIILLLLMYAVSMGIEEMKQTELQEKVHKICVPFTSTLMLCTCSQKYVNTSDITNILI